MKLTKEQVRAAFETWATREGINVERDIGGDYRWMPVISAELAWVVWQAARLATLREAARIAEDQHATKGLHYPDVRAVADAIRAAAGDKP